MKSIFLACNCLAALCWQSTSTTLAAEDVNVETPLMKKISAAQRENEELFSNMHAVWTEVRKRTDGKATETRHEFWSRDGLYFRIDEVTQPPGGEETSITRTLVCPQGSVRTTPRSLDEFGAVFDLKPGADGVASGTERLRWQRWFSQAYKVSSDSLDWTLGEWVAGRSNYKTLTVSKQADGRVLISALVDVETATNNEQFFLSSDDFRFLQGTTHVQRKDEKDDSGYRTTYTTTYGDQQADLPLSSTVEYRFDNGKTELTRYDLEEFQLEPSDLSVFFPDELDRVFAGPTEGVLTRRLTLMGIGATMLAVFFVVRKQRKASNGRPPRH